MGQRNAIVMFLLGGGLLVPMVLLGVTAAFLGRIAVPVGFAIAWAGFACLLAAKWPLLRQGKLWSFGAQSLSARGRKLYWAGYILMASGVFVAAVAPFNR